MRPMSRPKTAHRDKKTVQLAILNAGGRAEVARALGIWPSAVQKWWDTGRVSAERAIDLERLNGGKVSRAELRPDLFGDAA